MLPIHQNIKDKLDYFHKNKKIPNIIFNGPSGSGKRTLVYKFVSGTYSNTSFPPLNKLKIKS